MLKLVLKAATGDESIKLLNSGEYLTVAAKDQLHLELSRHDLSSLTKIHNDLALTTVDDQRVLLREFFIPQAAADQPILVLTDTTLTAGEIAALNHEPYALSAAEQAFWSNSPLTTAIAGSIYAYYFQLNTTDNPNNITIDVKANHGSLPPWLNLVDLGHHQYLLSGLPSAQDSGNLFIYLTVSTRDNNQVLAASHFTLQVAQSDGQVVSDTVLDNRSLDTSHTLNSGVAISAESSIMFLDSHGNNLPLFTAVAALAIIDPNAFATASLGIQLRDSHGDGRVTLNTEIFGHKGQGLDLLDQPRKEILNDSTPPPITMPSESVAPTLLKTIPLENATLTPPPALEKLITIPIEQHAAQPEIVTSGSGSEDNLVTNPSTPPSSTIITGTAGPDNLVGGAGNDTFFGGAGTDTFDGGPGTDTLNLSDLPFQPTVTITFNSLDTSSGTVTSASDGVETFTNMESIVGPPGDNRFIFSGPLTSPMTIDGSIGGGGDLKEIDLPPGLTATVDMQAGTATFGGQTVNFVNINTIRGNDQAVTVLGSNGVEGIFGGGGNDYIDGRGGIDFLQGEAGDDTLVFDPTDIGSFAGINGGSDTDTLLFTQAITFDFSGDLSFANIEIINLNNTGSNISLQGDDINYIAALGAALQIDGGSADTVNLVDAANWTHPGMLGAYEHYVNAVAGTSALIDPNIHVTPII